MFVGCIGIDAHTGPNESLLTDCAWEFGCQSPFEHKPFTGHSRPERHLLVHQPAGRALSSVDSD